MPARNAAAEMFTGVGMRDGQRQFGDAAALEQVVAEHVEEAGARAEHQIDGRAGDFGQPGHLIEAQRLRGRFP